MNSAAYHCDDPQLVKVLNKYNKKTALHIQDLESNALFAWNDEKIFKKGEKLRKRYKCYEVKSNRIYLFSPMAEVKRL